MCRTLSLIFFCFDLAAKITLKVGLPAFPPFAFDNSDETHVGSVVRYYQLLGDKAGLDIQVVRMPYVRMIKSLEDGRLDIAVIFRNADLIDFVNYTGRVSYAKVAIVPQKNRLIKEYQQLLQLSGIAVIRGASFGPKFDTDQNLKKYFVNDYIQGLSMLKLGRVNAVVGSLAGIEYTSSVIGVDMKGWGKPFLLSDKEWWLHFSKKSEHKITETQLKKAVQALYQTYLIYDLYDASSKSVVGK
jgi:polar amino acid transport system substrate-binding protein